MPFPSYACSGQNPKENLCVMWLRALESFGDCVGAKDKPPGDAMQTLLRLTQDAGLCAEQMQADFSSPRLVRVFP